jgi:Protein of unknown function (DUF4230)
MSNRTLPYILGLLATLVLGIFIAKWWYADRRETKQEATVLLEQVRAVSKLVTTEGYFSEILSETDTKLFYGFPSTKKVLIKVKAKVSAGYDLSNMKIDADAATKTLRLSNIPPPNIISIEPEISFYDIDNGVFNQFSPEDYSRLNKKAVDVIREQALKSTFMQTVNEQGGKNFDALRLLTTSLGWQLVFENAVFKN